MMKKDGGICSKHIPFVRRNKTTSGITLIALVVTILFSYDEK